MEIYRRGREVAHVCPKREYVTKILNEMDILKRISEIKSDTFFDECRAQLLSKIRLVRGEYPHFEFKYSVEGKHHKGSWYCYEASHGAIMRKLPRHHRYDDSFIFEHCEPIDVPSLSQVTEEDMVNAIDLLTIREILNM